MKRIVFSLCFCVGFLGAESIFWGLALANVNSLINLEIEKVHVSIKWSGDREQGWTDNLGEEAHRIFINAGLNPAPSKHQVPVGEASLEVTITTINLQEGSSSAEVLLGGNCQGKWLYDAKIELWEHMYPSRDPTRPVYSQIWGQHHLFPQIKEDRTFEGVRVELESMLIQFIADYQLANPKRLE